MNMSESLFLPCPHCHLFVEILKSQINCKIFRHGTMIQTFTQIDPHLEKSKIDQLVRNNEIYGCGKPFLCVTDDETTFRLEKCEYI